MEQQNMEEQAKVNTIENDEVSSVEWECIKMTEQEEDLIYRMHKLVGDRWDLVAGRIPGRKAEEIERFWIMKHIVKDSTREEKCSTVKISCKRTGLLPF